MAVPVLSITCWKYSSAVSLFLPPANMGNQRQTDREGEREGGGGASDTNDSFRKTAK